MSATQGPWQTRKRDDGDVEITLPDGSVLATVYGDDSNPHCWPVTENSKLIAAAPALADALEKAADTLRDAAAAYHFFGKHVAAEAMEIAERHSRETLRAAGRLP